MFNPGIGVRFDSARFAIEYDAGVFGPATEVRTLDSIRTSLSDPTAAGPDKLYAIAMDVGRTEDRELLISSMLLLGVVAYNAGAIGAEPVRSQGHVHVVSRHSGWSPPEVFEIWAGRAIVFMQESAGDDAGRCYAVTAAPGELIIVPPGWPHMVVNADVGRPMVFGAICDRGYEGFDYRAVRAHRGLAFYPVVESKKITWRRNESYASARLIEKSPETYAELLGPPVDTSHGPTPMYRRVVSDPKRFAFVPYPGGAAECWRSFVP